MRAEMKKAPMHAWGLPVLRLKTAQAAASIFLVLRGKRT
jgi:hypothetical protein